ncbi:Fic family protein [Pseudomonas sp. RGM2987]|uniref:Fic family protein n=1 Tax=Pseudomonas sp. RGM2987 TaxID=2930090 RepID=UPI001FD68BD9|nr:Fic family protein [Pseudomonas sp. RGM2987]MCJ8206149.1 Fic family protein [Pseudomonas sp. RGM2987]
MIKLPPPIVTNPFELIMKKYPALTGEYLKLYAPVDDKGRYQHYDTLRFRIPAKLDHSLAWSVVKSSRRLQLSDIMSLGAPPHVGRLLLTPAIQMAISESDRHTTAAALEWMSSKIGEQKHIQYLLKDLIEDEAISSSQLEGAATTTKVAKDLLKRQRGPRTPDEKMIIGNFRMMQCAWRSRNTPLSAELIAELHQVGVENIDDDHYRPGTFRSVGDNVVVEDGDGNVVHTPPTAEGLEERLNKLAEWINTNHTDITNKTYLHPLIKAIILHFSIGYEHPFHDGNGRVARSLFYWYLFKHDFAAFRYIAISTLLKSAPTRYGKSYVYTETDEMDLTYFVDYQCRIIARAISDFKAAYEETLEGMNKFNLFLYESGLFGKLNDKQKTVLQVAKSGRALEFTATAVKDNLGCSYNTAAAVLNGLVDHNLFQKRKEGREWIYTMIPASQIIKHWSP